MVVVNGGVDLVEAGKMSFVVSSIVPTSAGRIVFARPEDMRRSAKDANDGPAADGPNPATPSVAPTRSGTRRSARHDGGVLVGAVVVAAGHGARFGGPKQLQPLGDRRVVDHAVDGARATCDAVVLVVPPDATWSVDGVAVGGRRRDALRVRARRDRGVAAPRSTSSWCTTRRVRSPTRRCSSG